MGTEGFKKTIQETSFGNSSLFTELLIAFAILGSLAFVIATFAFITKEILKDRRSFKWSKKRFILKFLLILAILPIYLLLKVFKPLKIIKKFKDREIRQALNFKQVRAKELLRGTLTILITLFIILPVWAGIGLIAVDSIGRQFGFVEEQIPVGGTGSMYPTFPKGQGKTLQEQAKEVVGSSGMKPYPNGLVLFGKRFFGYEIERGDIVVLENDMLREYNKRLLGEPSGWVKRVVAIGGDTLEIKDGIVYLNDKPLKEPYIAKARATFGESFLKECQKVTIPQSSIFVMGDNRKGSGDSREVGVFSINDVKYVLPLKSQKGDLVKNWRDTSKDFDESSKIKMDKEKYIKLLNEKRKEIGGRYLKYQPKLELSGQKRGEVILKYDDFSYEATKSGYTQLRAMNEVGYSNIVYGEAPILGYYEAEELLDNQFEFPDLKEFLLHKDYQEIGIAEVEGILNGCPTQVIVQHFAGYVPPNYSKEDIESWRKALSNLNDVIPSWEKAKGYKGVNQDDLQKLLSLFYREREIASRVLLRMETNQWLTGEKNKMIEEYNQLSQESINLADKLNKR